MAPLHRHDPRNQVRLQELARLSPEHLRRSAQPPRHRQLPLHRPHRDPLRLCPGKDPLARFRLARFGLLPHRGCAQPPARLIRLEDHVLAVRRLPDFRRDR